MNKNVFDEYIEKEFPNVISDICDMISVKSVSVKSDDKNFPFGKDCALALEMFLKKASDMGFITNNIDNYVGTVSFDDREAKLGILCHLDVVPADESGWTVTKPFEPVVKDNKIFGRGAIDDKGPAVAVLYAMKIIKNAGIALNKNVKFIVGCDEENGSSDIEYYRKKESFPEYVFTPDGDFPVINFEKGMLRVEISCDISDKYKFMNAGKVANAVPEKAEIIKENGEIVSVQGKSAHASTPDRGDNALTKLIEKLSETTTDDIWKKLAKLFPYGDNNGKGLGIYASDDETGEVTCVLSMAEIRKGKFVGCFDVRYPNNVVLEEITGKIDKILYDNDFEIRYILKENHHYVSPESDFVKKLLKVYEDETGENAKPVAIGGGTYVHDIEGGVAFGAEFPGENNNMHGNDESIKIDSLKKSIRLYLNAILEICK